MTIKTCYSTRTTPTTTSTPLLPNWRATFRAAAYIFDCIELSSLTERKQGNTHHNTQKNKTARTASAIVMFRARLFTKPMFQRDHFCDHIEITPLFLYFLFS